MCIELYEALAIALIPVAVVVIAFVWAVAFDLIMSPDYPPVTPDPLRLPGVSDGR